MRRTPLAAAIAAGAIMFSPMDASAATQNGLVNVNIEDVTVQIPVAVAANVCGVNVGILVDTLDAAPTDCEAGSISLAESPGGGGGGNTQQRGLVNVNLEDVEAQVPIGIAANVCGVNAGILVQDLDGGFTDCDSGAMAISR